VQLATYVLDLLLLRLLFLLFLLHLLYLLYLLHKRAVFVYRHGNHGLPFTLVHISPSSPLPPPAANAPNEEYLSFFSGDATIACTLASCAICLAKIRLRDYTSADHAYAISLPLGITTLGMSPYAYIAWTFALIGSFMRIAAYMHWFTDVMVGILFGWMCGYLPLFAFQSKAAADADLEVGLLADPHLSPRPITGATQTASSNSL